jgi:outer membrane protein assembly factor BamB
LSSGDESRQTISRYDALSGALVWERDIARLVGKKALHGEIGPDTGYAAPSPATDGQRVFAMYPSGFLVCLDYAGNLLWFKDFGIPDIPYGYASSPLALGDLLVVQFDTRNLALLIALRAEDGSKAWEVERRREPSWASPVAAGDAILVAGNPHVEAYKARSGRLLWEAPFLGAETAPSPAFEGGRAFFVTAYTRVCAVDIRAQAERFARGEAVESLWEGRELLPDIASPLAVGGRLYLAASYGFVSCLDAESGATLWRKRVASEIKASPVSHGGLIYVADGEGRIHRIIEGGSYEALAPIELGEAVYATPAIAHGRLYARSLGALFAFDLDEGAER